MAVWWQHWTKRFPSHLFSSNRLPNCLLTSPTSKLLLLDEFHQTVCTDRVSSTCSKQCHWRLPCTSVVVVSGDASVVSRFVYDQPLADWLGQDKARFSCQLFISRSRIELLCCCLNNLPLIKNETLWTCFCMFYKWCASNSLYFFALLARLDRSIFLYYVHWFYNLSFVHLVVSKITSQLRHATIWRHTNTKWLE